LVVEAAAEALVAEAEGLAALVAEVSAVVAQAEVGKILSITKILPQERIFIL